MTSSNKTVWFHPEARAITEGRQTEIYLFLGIKYITWRNIHVSALWRDGCFTIDVCDLGGCRVRDVKMPIHSSKRSASPSGLSSTWLSRGGQRGAGGHERIMGEQLTLIRSERHSGWPQDPRRAQPNHSSHWLWQMSAAQRPTPTQKSSHWSHREKIPP